MPGSRLSLLERGVIERGLAAGMRQGQIAVVLGRSPSTISREVRRGGGPRSSRPGPCPIGRPRRYRAGRAQSLASARARRPKPFKLVGLAGGSVPVGFFRLPQEAHIVSSAWGTMSDLREVVALAREGKIDCRIQRFGLDEINEAYEALARGEIEGRAVIHPQR